MPGFDTDDERDAYVTRQRLIEHRGFADGITLQEVAQRLLDRQAWSYVEVDLLGLLDVIGVEFQVGTPKFDAAAKHLLRRLAEHEFSDWQPNIRQAIAPIAAVLPPTQMVSVSALAAGGLPRTNAAPIIGTSHPLSEVLLAWQVHSKAGRKDWKNLLVRLPPQPKAELAKLTLPELADYADAHNLKRLSAESVTKYLQAMRSVLGQLRQLPARA